MSTEKAIKSFLNNNLNEMRENLNLSLAEKATQKINEKKQAVAKDFVRN